MTETTFEWSVDEAGLAALASVVAARVRLPFLIALHGDLGAGKTTFARALIRALMSDPVHDVPSPTFALRQDYAAPMGTIAHFDFYRLSGPADLDELGFGEALDVSIVVVEWPERVAPALPSDRIDVFLTELALKETRTVKLIGHGSAKAVVAAVAAGSDGACA